MEDAGSKISKILHHKSNIQIPLGVVADLALHQVGITTLYFDLSFRLIRVCDNYRIEVASQPIPTLSGLVNAEEV